MRTATARLDHDITPANRARGLVCALATGLLAAVALLGGTTVAAQGPCTAITNDAERLACYDRALRPAEAAPAPQRAAQPAPQSAPQATTQPAPQPPGQPAQRTVRPTNVPVPSAAPTARSGQPQSEEVVAITIVGVRAPPNRSVTFTTDTGDVWIQTDSIRHQLPPTPFRAELKRGAMSSYFLVPETRSRAVRVRRGP